MTKFENIVLIGLGHAHLYVGARADEFRRRGLRLTLIDDGEFWYSSIGSGMLGGRYERADDVIDAQDFSQRYGITFVRGRAASIDREHRQIILEDGREVAYDLLSLNVGSHVAPPFPTSGDGIWSPKPISGLLQLREELKARFREGEPVKCLTVGGNHSGCELTLNALALARAEGGQLESTLITDCGELIESEPPGARKAMLNALQDAGCNVCFGVRVEAADSGVVTTGDGRTFAFDIAMIATGLQPSDLICRCGVSYNARGLIVNASLHSPEDDRIFAAGDCASISGFDLAKVGVFGVRASP
ncbi:MAG: FAD-dependent oxidoreductase, partial [Pseudomonadota bacterium]